MCHDPARLIFPTLVFLSVFFLAPSWAGRILIDPGHGGAEHGAVGIVHGQKIIEKDLALEFALILKDKLTPRHQVFLTRTEDISIDLLERAKVADKVKADIVISLHFNSAQDKNSGGFETYYLDNKRDKAVKKVEEIENAGLKGEDLIINQILIDLVVERTVESSKKLAYKIHSSVSKKIKGKYQIRDRGVKPGMFFILALGKRPGVLIEAGFLSNLEEISKVQKKEFLEDYAQGIADGIGEKL